MIKKILSICGVLALCACIAVVPCFAIETAYYDGQNIIQLLGAQYRLELSGIADDAIALFDTRGMYWLPDNASSIEDASYQWGAYSSNNPEVYYNADLMSDIDNSVIYVDFLLTVNDADFPDGDLTVETFMQSDRFTLGSDARLGLHLSPIYNSYNDVYVMPAGETTSATITFHALNTDGDVINVPMYRNDLVVGGTYDLTARFEEFFDGNLIQYYWIEYEGWNVVPTFVQDFSFRATMPWTDVRVVDWATDIVYPEVISYEDFNLLSWLGSAIDGFLTTTIFSVGGIDVTLGVIVSIPLTIMILIVFLKKFAGG